MVHSTAQLLALQSNIKHDPEGYKDEFDLQYKHYKACLDIFKLKPSNDSREFIDLISFVAQVSKCYADVAPSFASELMALLEAQYAVLDSSLRKALVQALILMRNRHQLDPVLLLPLLFRLFSVNDKGLRELLFRHIIADLKASNQKGRNERLNRAVQSFLFRVLQEDNELAAKKALAVLTELWRRNIWRDSRTVNCIATAVFHKSPRVMLAALKFFMGQDTTFEDSDEEGDDGDVGGNKNAEVAAVAGPTKEEVYKATHKGTKSSKKKKQAKLKRVMQTVKKAARREAASVSEGFAALHLLHDPQTFAERLAARLGSSRERWETRLAMMQVVSRVIGVHKLLVLNFYPFLQKYIAPHQRDVTLVLAALVQAVHDLVPPETLAPVLRQLVDQFVHDKARPEVMTVGLKTVRELCFRCPLVMSGELLQDLAEYKKFRDKEVAAAARGLIGLFRDINPALLNKKDRGRGADLAAGPQGYGVMAVAQRVEGADLLQEALLRGDDWEDSDSDLDSEQEGGSSEEGEEVESGSEEGEEESGAELGSTDEDEGEEEEEGSEEAGEASDEEGSQLSGSGSEGADSEEAQSESESEEAAAAAAAAARQGEASTSGRGSSQQQRQGGSLSDLKRQLAAAKAAKQAAAGGGGGVGGGGGPGEAGGEAAPEVDASVPLEMQRILTEEDFQRIRQLKHKRLVEAAMARHGLKATSAAKRRRLKESAEEEAEEALALAAARAKLGEAKVNPDDLKGVHKRRKDKAERLASVLAGREGREAFGARSALKKKKMGGLSEREKQRKKQLPVAARIQQLRNRATKSRQKNNPRHFKGHVRK